MQFQYNEIEYIWFRPHIWTHSHDIIIISNVFQIRFKLKDLRAHIFKVAREESYMGEKIPLRWLKFEEAKGAAKEPMMNIMQVLTKVLNRKSPSCYVWRLI